MSDLLRQQLAHDGLIDLVVRVRPGARSSCKKEQRADGVWKIDIAAVPEDGAANDELRRFLAEEFDVPRVSIVIVSGQTSREKRVRITRPC